MLSADGAQADAGSAVIYSKADGSTAGVIL